MTYITAPPSVGTSVDVSELGFDPATQAELDAVVAGLAGVDNSTIELSGGNLRLKDGGTTLAKLASAAVDAIMPWRIEINPFVSKTSTVGTWTTGSNASVVTYGHFFNSSAAQNDYVTYDLAIAAGTWEVAVIGTKNTTGGICTPSIGGVDGTTIDQYAAAPAFNTVQTSTVVVPTSGKQTLKLLVASKNASSSAYQFTFYWMTLRRTA